MKPADIQSLRHALGESTAVFGARFHRSGRTVEGWEQGVRRPDRFIVEALASLQQKVTGPKRRERVG